MKVTFIGLGIMGSRMASRLLAAGVELTVYNRDRSKAAELVRRGAKMAESLADAVSGAEIVFTMLSTPGVVGELSEGFLPNMSRGSLWVDCSTVSPADVRENASKAQEAGVEYLEAPVAGTKQPAENGQLVFFVGGGEPLLTQVQPLLSAMGKKTLHTGPHGTAASIKILVNLLLAQSMLAFSEAVKLGTAMGLSQDQVMSTLLNVPVTAPFLQNVREKLETEETSPNFPLPLMLKDMGLVLQTAESLDLKLPSAEIAEEMYRRALDSGREEEDFSSVFHFVNAN